MGKATGFLEYERQSAAAKSPQERITHFREFHTPLSEDRQREQAARCMDCGVPFCQAGVMLGGMVSGCPLHNLVPETNDLVYTGNLKEAYERLSQTHCFPEFTCRVCPALCEAACTCNLHDEPVATKENERLIIETAFEKGWVKPETPAARTGKKVAVVGSGPAGLAAAVQLNKRGHQVTVYERSDRAGGLLRYGIPNMKIEKSVLDRRLKIMEDSGIRFVTGTEIGTDLPAETLMQSYDRVILAGGASRPRDIDAPGRRADGIYFAVDFLKSVTQSLLDSELNDKQFISAKGKHVVIIGGGDTGNDCVGTSIRLGAASVTQIEMMPKPPSERAANNPWPQWPKVLKTDYGQQEAIAVFGEDPRIYETTVTKFIADEQNQLKQVKLVSLSWEKEPNTGRMKMVPVPGSERVIDADLVLIAAGFLGAEEGVCASFGAALNPRGVVATEKDQYAASAPNVFTAGDMHRGQSLVVWAVKEGMEAAKAVDISLMGYTNLP